MAAVAVVAASCDGETVCGNGGVPSCDGGDANLIECGDRVTIRVDYREHSLMQALGTFSLSSSSCVPCSSEGKKASFQPEIVTWNLDVGDVHIVIDDALRAVIERKTISDLAASIADGRLYEQKERLRALADDGPPSVCIIYVIEGSAWSWSVRTGSSGVGVGVRPSAMQGALLSMMIPGGGNCPSVIWTTNVTETAALVHRITKFLHTGTRRHKPPVNHNNTYTQKQAYDAVACRSSVKVKKRSNMDSRLCFLQQLCQIPGVSHRIAVALADALNVGCMSALVEKLGAATGTGADAGTSESAGEAASSRGGKTARGNSKNPRVRMLSDIPGVGAKTSESIVRTLFDES